MLMPKQTSLLFFIIIVPLLLTGMEESSLDKIPPVNKKTVIITQKNWQKIKAAIKELDIYQPQVVIEYKKPKKLTKGQRRRLQRKRAKARPANQSASDEFYEYFKSYLVATDNPTMPATSLEFFRAYVLFWTDRYHELGILDTVLDTYFETTQATPNTIVIDPFLKKKTSFLQYSAHLTTFGNTNAKILFKKLLEHDGDYALKINGFSTDDLIKKQYQELLSGEIIFDNDKNIDLVRRKKALKNTKEIVNFLIKFEQEKRTLIKS